MFRTSCNTLVMCCLKNNLQIPLILRHILLCSNLYCCIFVDQTIHFSSCFLFLCKKTGCSLQCLFKQENAILELCNAFVFPWYSYYAVPLARICLQHCLLLVILSTKVTIPKSCFQGCGFFPNCSLSYFVRVPVQVYMADPTHMSIMRLTHSALASPCVANFQTVLKDSQFQLSFALFQSSCFISCNLILWYV